MKQARPRSGGTQFLGGFGLRDCAKEWQKCERYWADWATVVLGSVTVIRSKGWLYGLRQKIHVPAAVPDGWQAFSLERIRPQRGCALFLFCTENGKHELLLC
ncbi:MAG: hypothetical protein DMG87_06825 [Acidobacteria bacterium]|nr:MAG: hypothetical protein DMG87_06825 [Acidobacteriota bacterium]